MLQEIGLNRVTDSAAGRDLLRRVRRRLADLAEQGHLPPRERAEAANVLAYLGDPRPELTTVDGIKFCAVPPGPFMLGSDEDSSEKPLHRFDLKHGYWISQHPLTVAQFREFVQASGHQPDSGSRWEGIATHPVVYVTWFDAVAFCHWLTQTWRAADKLPANWQVRLPTEPEWERRRGAG